MSRIIGIVGPSGSGKSTSLRNLDPAKTFIINVSKKDLPFKGWKSKFTDFRDDNENGNLYNEDESAKIVKALHYIDKKREDIDKIVIDDAQYIMASEFMNRSQESGWQKFTDIAKNMWNVVNTARNLSRDIDVIFTFHSEEVSDGFSTKHKIKTIGKMVDDKITLEGLFTMVLYTDVEIDQNTKEPDFRFQTKTDGTNTCKTPLGMFEDVYIPNDMEYVFTKMNEYYN